MAPSKTMRSTARTAITAMCLLLLSSPVYAKAQVNQPEAVEKEDFCSRAFKCLAESSVCLRDFCTGEPLGLGPCWQEGYDFPGFLEPAQACCEGTNPLECFIQALGGSKSGSGGSGPGNNGGSRGGSQNSGNAVKKGSAGQLQYGVKELAYTLLSMAAVLTLAQLL